jgi:predicted nucleic acid-binding protein
MIVDTMVMAYALLGVPEYEDESLEALRRADALYAPATVEAELLNVLWQYSKRGVSSHKAAQLYEHSRSMWTQLIPVKRIWPEALALAFENEHSPYDTLFVATARLYSTLVITCDQKLLTLFPDDTITVSAFLKL